MKITNIKIARGHRITAAALLVFLLFTAFALTSHAESARVYPGGMTFGVRFSTDGVMIVAVSDVETGNGSVNPGEKAGLAPGDIITVINGSKPSGIGDLKDAAKCGGGSPISLTVDRGGDVIKTEITPVPSKDDGEYKLGLWVRDGSAGIGTVTFIMPETLEFAGLGHGICDNETGALLPVKEGVVLGVSVSGVKPGLPGLPGELTGFLTADPTGTLISNTDTGAYGVFDKTPANIHGTAVDAAECGEITEGEAYIYCTVDGEDVGEYSVEIEKIIDGSSEEKNFIVRVTDEYLLSKTGGIVQGMSGSPVMQNGRLVGAVTHVMINDPTRGYGIFVENMLENIPQIVSQPED